MHLMRLIYLSFFFLTCEFCVSDCKVEYDPSVMFPGNSVGQRAVLKGH